MDHCPSNLRNYYAKNVKKKKGNENATRCGRLLLVGNFVMDAHVIPYTDSYTGRR